MTSLNIKDREHFRNCAASHDQIKGLPLEQDRTRYDLQARASGGEELASSARLRPVAESHLRCKVQQRNRGRQIASSNRCRLTRPSPRFGDSSKRDPETQMCRIALDANLTGIGGTCFSKSS